MTNDLNYALRHYGVRGMRWGVTKNKRTSSDAKTADRLSQKKVGELTNKELETYLRRINLEARYSSSKSSSKSKKAAKKAAEYVSSQAGKMLVNEMLRAGTAAAKDYIQEAIK